MKIDRAVSLVVSAGFVAIMVARGLEDKYRSDHQFRREVNGLLRESAGMAVMWGLVLLPVIAANHGAAMLVRQARQVARFHQRIKESLVRDREDDHTPEWP